MLLENGFEEYNPVKLNTSNGMVSYASIEHWVINYNGINFEIL